MVGSLFKFSLLLIFLAFSKLGFSHDEFILDQQTASSTIIVTKSSSPDVEHAAQLFQKYLKEISSFHIPIHATVARKKQVIALKTDKQLHPDGYTIEIKSNAIYITGGERKGCTYAVIYLLEKYAGCKYLSPTYKVVPSSASLTFPVTKITDQPKNDRRIINLYFNEDQEYRDWHQLQTIETFYPENYFVHTFHRLIPWETYFADEPDLFALVNGKRVIDQLCLSNPKTAEMVIDQLSKQMKQEPNKTIWSVSQNDNFSYCQCDQCSAIIKEEGSPSGPIIRFVNRVAKEFPDKIISTLAYQYSRSAPQLTKPLDNVEIMLCTIELFRHQSIAENPESAAFKEDIIAWGKISKQLYLWDYTINFNHSVSPFPNLHILQPNIQFFTDNHVNALFEQSNSTTGYEFSELKVHLLSKLMWNPDCDINREMELFVRDYYGEAGTAVLAYIHLLQEELVQTGAKLWIYEHPTQHENDLFSVARLEQYMNLFDTAEALVADNPVYLNHVQLARLSLQYAQMEIAANNMFTERGWYQLENGKRQPREKLFQTLEQFHTVCIRNQVPTLNELKLTPEDYYQSMKRLTNVSVEGNKAFGKKVTPSVSPDKKYAYGDVAYLTNGVRGASDYNVHWIGWNGTSTILTLDLESTTTAKHIELSSLWNGKSWILHPAEVSCSVSEDGINYTLLGKRQNKGDQEVEDVIKTYFFDASNQRYRYVKVEITGTHTLFNWHPSAGEPSWFFIDEIIVTD